MHCEGTCVGLSPVDLCIGPSHSQNENYINPYLYIYKYGLM